MTTAGQPERPKRMLVIDDNKGWCEIVGVMANSLGYSVEAVGSPDEAYVKLAQAQQEGFPFRLAIVDMRFEIGDYNVSLGKDVIKTIKDNYPQTACILSSGEKLTPGDVLDLRDDYGLDYCLPKVDIERDKLNYAINRALEVNMVLRKLRLSDVTAPIMPAPSIIEEKPRGNTPPKVFISYSHKDEHFKDELIIMLASLQRRGVIDAWQDRRIEPGFEWFRSIQEAMNECQIALLLVSSDFLASEFVTGNELPELFQLRKMAGMRAIPIIVRDCLWRSEPVLQDLQALPRDGRPIISFSRETGDRDHVWMEIAKAIENLARKLA
jgi:CheY-like chemotaxis protein